MADDPRKEAVTKLLLEEFDESVMEELGYFRSEASRIAGDIIRLLDSMGSWSESDNG